MKRCESVLRAIWDVAETAPDSVALVSLERNLTYAQLLTEVEALASQLQAAGVCMEERVGVLCERGAEWVVAMLGVWRAGAAYVPLDPNYPDERLNFLVSDSGMQVVLTTESQLDRVPESVKTCIAIDRLTSVPSQPLNEFPNGEDIAYLIYTSGSTGTPKGVLVEHRSLTNLILAINEVFRLHPNDRVLQFVSPNFDPSVMDVALTLANGATLVLRTSQMADSFSLFLQGLEQNQVSVVSLPTAFWHGMVDVLAALKKPELPVGLRLIYFGGERADPLRFLRWRDLFGNQVRLVNAYGPTEVTVAATAWDASEWLRSEDTLSGVPIGRPLGNVEAIIVDEDGLECHVDKLGELCLGGIQLARGYHNRPDATAKAFFQASDELPVGGRLYRTGDRVLRRGDNLLECFGRIDDQLKIRGYRIEPGEVEVALREQPNVNDAVVIGQKDLGGELQLVGYVVPSLAESFDPQALMAAVRNELPAHMVPTMFMSIDRLPLTPNGKVDRNRLPQPVWGVSRRPGTPPESQLECELADIWAELLRVSSVNREDDFFELGGHSLLAIRMLTFVDQRMNVVLGTDVLFESRTLARFAAIIEESTSSPTQILSNNRALSSASPRRLSLLQFDFITFERVQASLGFGVYPFVTPACLRLHGPLDIPALEASLNDIVQRHEILRTVLPPVPRSAGWPLYWIVRKLFEQATISRWLTRFSAQQILRGKWLESVRIEVLDRTTVQFERQSCPGPTGMTQAISDANRDWWPGYSRERGKSVRGRLVQLNGSDHLLFIAIDHMVSDGYSVQVLIDDLVAFYRARVAGKPAPPPLRQQFFSWVAQLTAQPPTLTEQAMDYWRSVYQQIGPVASTPLPFYRGAWPADGFCERSCHNQTILSSAAFENLQKVAAAHGVSVFVLMLSVLAVVLSRHAGTQSVVVMINVANREDADVRKMIGLCANIMPVLIDCADASFHDLIHSVDDTIRICIASQSMPWPELRSRMVLELEKVPLPRNPIFAPQVLFDFYALRPAEQVSGGLTLEEVYVSDPPGHGLLQFVAVQDGLHLTAHSKYSPDLYDPDGAERLFQDFVGLLSSVPESSNVPITGI